MPDIFTTAKRSDVMSRIRGRGNRNTELRLIDLFREYEIKGWRRHQPVFGRPDFIFRKERVAVFVDGCFWHGCPKPKHAPVPKTRTEWWRIKLDKNKARDKLVSQTLHTQRWHVLRIWECDLETREHWPLVAQRIKRGLRARTSLPSGESASL